MAFKIKETNHKEPGWKPDGSYGLPNETVWQLFEDDLWIADFDSPDDAQLAVIDLELAVEESNVLDLTDDSVS